MKPDPSQQTYENSDEYIRLSFQTALEDIRFFKKQQWLITNYTVLIYGAIVTVSRLVKLDQNNLLIYVPLIIGLASLGIISLIQYSMHKARNRKKAAIQKLPRNTKHLFSEESTSRIINFFERYSVFGLLFAVISFGCFLSMWLLLQVSC